MKQVLILALATASFAGLGLAAPCGTASLASYSAASFSCTIGGDTLSNFSVLAPLYGSQIANGSIIVTPSGGTFNPTLTFSTNPLLNASGGNAFETYFSYDISGLPYVAISSTLSGSSETGDGAVTDIVSFCEGASFDSNGVCSMANSSLSTVDGAHEHRYGGLRGRKHAKCAERFRYRSRHYGHGIWWNVYQQF